MKPRLEKLGTVGAVVAAVFCPVCFPKLALVGAVLGFGALAPFEGWFVAAVHMFLLVALIGHVVAFRWHRNPWVVTLAGLSVALVVGPLWIHYIEFLVYLGFLGIVVTTIWSSLLLRRCTSRGASIEPISGA